MTTRCFAMVLLVVSLLAPSLSADAAVPRLRPTDREMRQLLADGVATSASLRAIVERLDALDVVVYIGCARLPLGLDGRLTFVSAGGGLRYVTVGIAWDRRPSRRIAILGHELQHALEIAERPAIVDAASLAREYRHFGFSRAPAGGGRMAFDTTAAIDAGDRILRELHGAE